MNGCSDDTTDHWAAFPELVPGVDDFTLELSGSGAAHAVCGRGEHGGADGDGVIYIHDVPTNHILSLQVQR